MWQGRKADRISNAGDKKKRGEKYGKHIWGSTQLRGKRGGICSRDKTGPSQQERDVERPLIVTKGGERKAYLAKNTRPKNIKEDRDEENTERKLFKKGKSSPNACTRGRRIALRAKERHRE